MANPHTAYIIKGPIDEHTDFICSCLIGKVVDDFQPIDYRMPPHSVDEPELQCRCYIEGTIIKLRLGTV